MRAGILGAGWIGRRHAENLASRADVAVAAVCDLEVDRAGQVAAAVGGARVFGNWRQMLDQAELDALWICTPPMAHADPAVAALEHGLPLYLEKPIARSEPDATRIVAAARGAVCAVGYQWRAVDVLADLRASLAGQTIGFLVGESVGSTQARPWFLNQAEGGGNLLERGSHHIDLARAVAGEVVAVQAAQSAVRLAPRQPAVVGDIADAVTILLHFADGGLGTIVVAWTSAELPGRYWLEVTAPDAALRLDLDPEFRVSGVSRGSPVAATSSHAPFERSVDRFIAAARQGAPAQVLCTPADAARTLAVALAAEEALRTGQACSVSSLPGPYSHPATTPQ
jgi:myo-inositol 2-dehydrogenase / D-chiro-inositol 1-dehydrogenase